MRRTTNILIVVIVVLLLASLAATAYASYTGYGYATSGSESARSGSVNGVVIIGGGPGSGK